MVKTARFAGCCYWNRRGASGTLAAARRFVGNRRAVPFERPIRPIHGELMATASSVAGGSRARLSRPRAQSAYERFASMLITLLIIIGAVVGCMFIVWLTSRIRSTQVPVPVILDNLGGGRPDGVLGESMKIEAPEYNELTKETDIEVEQEKIQDTAALIVDAIALKQADLEDPAITEELEGSPTASRADGTGNAYALGEGPGQGGGVPREQRWKIRFDQTTQAVYAKQLDFFKIELGIMRPDRVEYARGFTQATPTKRTARTGEKEDRLFFTWEDGALQKYDRQLLTKAGINADGMILQFFSPEAENQLAFLESKFSNRDLRTVRRTVFGVRASGNGFTFYVMEQQTF